MTGVQTCALPICIKSGGAAATKNGQDKKRGRCRNENLAKKKRDAAATRNGQYKKRGRCRNEKWSVKKAGALPQREPGQYRSEERRGGKECRSRWAPDP